jgi:hypothetical protein
VARRHARNSRLYMALTSGGTAEPIAFINQWNFDQNTDTAEVTALGDTNKIYVSGLPDASGSLSGWYDDATVQTYTAALDGQPRKFYQYSDIVNDPGQYWFGTILVDFSLKGGVSDALAFSANWKAASSIAKVG